ncbi:MAG: DUF2029 domain-containing protein [Actinobacteria bacterium]|nr:MAG: DUF2029 domain-containing protein [Actinomycetota bacterium]
MARLVVIGLVALHVLLATVLLADDSLHTGTFAERSDAARFHKIAIAPGEPYRDFEVEYPPALVVTSKVLDDGSFPAFVDRLILVNLVADLGCALMLGLWGRKAVVSYLVLSAPLLPLVLTKLDVVAVAIALAAVALVHRKRERLGGAVLGIAGLFKLWPAVLVVLWIASARWRAVRWAVGTGAVGALMWMVVSGPDALWQVITFRGARGWHVESLPGVALALFDSGPMRFEAGSWRVGTPGTVFGLILAVAMLAAAATVGTAFARSRRRGDNIDETGIPAAGVVAAVLATATLLSPQFIVWLLPWVAIARNDGDVKTERLTLAVIIVTIIASVSYPPSQSDRLLAQVMYWVRNLVIAGIAIHAYRRLRAPTHDRFKTRSTSRTMADANAV